MADSLPIPRKRRTRGHVIADQSLHFVERFIGFANYTSERVREDYGFDLVMKTFDENGYAESGEVLFQLKASDTIKGSSSGEHWVFSLRIEDYNLWQTEYSPIFLVLYDAQRRRGYWLYVQEYFEEDSARRPRRNAASVRLFIPKMNRVGVRFIHYARRRMISLLRQMKGVIHYHD